MGKHEELTGQRFERLVVLSFDGRNDNGNAIWRVRCDCGVEFTALASELKRGGVRSCGCLRREMMMGNHRHTKKEPGNPHR